MQPFFSIFMETFKKINKAVNNDDRNERIINETRDLSD